MNYPLPGQAVHTDPKSAGVVRSPQALAVTLVIVGEEAPLYTPVLFVPNEALAVTFVIVGEEGELYTP